MTKAIVTMSCKYFLPPVNWISGKTTALPFERHGKISYHTNLARSTLTASDIGVMAEIEQCLRDITPGQSTVFYKIEKVLGIVIFRADGI